MKTTLQKTVIDLGNVQIPMLDYASEGNAMLGIRESGKSSSATFIAERMIEAGIPFVAFDPVGVWKYLRVPGKGRGYPIVIAGGRNGDLPLTPESAPEIVRAAMRENIPLVLDLYDINLTKADWKRIVEQSIRLLLYENGDYGLRHIFIEEAAEFVPQRVGPDQGKVYAEIEKLARMGGNALLGYTLINQRAEEVNKAVLELCDCLFLHRQKGRNSLIALGKWLDAADVADHKQIAKSLPRLEKGQAWIWTQGSVEPMLAQVPLKNSKYPDRRSMIVSSGSKRGFDAVDVTAFIQKLEAALSAEKESDESAPKAKAVPKATMTMNLKPDVQPETIHALNEVGRALASHYGYEYEPAQVDEEEEDMARVNELEAENKRLEGIVHDLRKELAELKTKLATAPKAAAPAVTAPNGHGAPVDFEALYQQFRARARQDPELVNLIVPTPQLTLVREIKPVEANTDTMFGKVVYLLHQGFFTQPKAASDARRELIRLFDLGIKTPTANVATELSKLVSYGYLTNETDGYQAVAEMRKNIVQAR